MSTDPRPVLIRQIAALPRVIEGLNTLAWRDVMSEALPEMEAIDPAPPPFARLVLRKVPGVFNKGDLVELARDRPLTRAFAAKPGARALVSGSPHMSGARALVSGSPHMSGRHLQVPVTWTDPFGASLRGIQSDGNYDVRDFDHVEAEEAPPAPPRDVLVRLNEIAASYRKFSAIAAGMHRGSNSKGILEMGMDAYRAEAEELRKTYPGLPGLNEVGIT